MQVTRCLFTITGTTNDVALRSFSTHIGNTDVEGLYTEVTAGGTNVSTGALSQIAHAIMKPQVEVSGHVNIDNGFDTRRMRFFMEVDHGYGVRQILSGYTNHVGLTPSGHVDPNMILYFNQSFKMTDTKFSSPTMGNQIKTSITDASHYITPVPLSQNAMMGLETGAKSTTMRPSDVMEQFDMIHAARDWTMDNATGFGGPNDADFQAHNLQVVGTRSEFNEGVRMSKIKNGHSADYLSKVIGGYTNASATNTGYDEYNTVGSQAATFAQDSLISTDQFVSGLTNAGINFNEGGSVSWGKLVAAFPEVAHIANFNDLSQRMQAMPVLDSRGQAEHWNGSTHETNIATILNNSVPSVMIDTGLTCLEVTIQSCTAGVHLEPSVGSLHGTTMNGIHVMVTDARSFAGLSIDQLRQYVPAIEQQLATTVALEISSGGNVPVLANVFIDLLGENRISVAYNYGPLIQYINPTYCSSLSTPVLANNESVAINMANDLAMLCETSAAQSEAAHNGLTYY